MKKAFTVLELVFVVVMIGIMAGVSIMYIPQTNLQQAADYVIQNLKYTKSLAQLDDRFYTMRDDSIAGSVSVEEQSKFWQAGMWQMQFHVTGANAKNSYSIYSDTGRGALSTNFDGRPMAGDLIAKDAQNKSCLSGYTMTNLPTECNNNIAKEVKLEETYGVVISNHAIQANCAEGGGFRVYFDNSGLPYCGNVTINGAASIMPRRLTQNILITLKRRNQTATVCISPGGLIYGSSNGVCDRV